MAAKVVRFQSREDVAKRQLADDLDKQLALFSDQEVPPFAREVVRNWLYRLAHPSSEAHIWPGGYCMISRQQTEAVWDAIRKLPSELRPHQVRHAFDLVLLYLKPDTGEVMLSRQEMAAKMETDAANVSRVMRTLEDMEVVHRKRRRVDGVRGPGLVVYLINPYVAWNGRLDVRLREAEKTKQPSLKLVQREKA